jgi:hypothetical protein
MDWTVEHAGHTYTTAMWPLLLVGLGAAVVLPVGVWLLLATRRWPRGWGVGRILGAVVIPLLPLIFAVAIGVIMLENMDISADASRDTECRGNQFVSSWHVFGRLVAIQLSLALLTLIISAKFVAISLGRRVPEDGWARVAIPGAGLCFCVLVGLLGSVHATWLAGYGGLPALVQDGPGYYHTGREATLTVRNRACRVPSGWVYPRPVPIPTDKRGRFARTVVATAPWFTVRSTVIIHVGRETGGGVLPLRAGNRWVYEVRNTSNGRALLGLIPMRNGPAEDTATIEVSGGEVRNGLQTYRVTVSDWAGNREFSLFAFEGRVLGTTGDRTWFVLRTAAPAGRNSRPVTSRYFVDPYDFVLLGARCQGFGPEMDGPLGPAECHRGASGHDPHLGVFSTIMTGGLVTYTGGASMHARLLRSSWGDDTVRPTGR